MIQFKLFRCNNATTYQRNSWLKYENWIIIGEFVPYVVIILLVSLNRRIPFGDDTSNCNLCDLHEKKHTESENIHNF